jgi:RNA 3'-terminal phosphate cyclase (RTC), insert domain
MQIKKRGAPPAGGGEIQFVCPIVKQVKTLNFVEPGKIKRIRGIASVSACLKLKSSLRDLSHAVRVNPQFSNRMIEASRSVLNRYIPDIYLYSDVYKGDESGKSVLSSKTVIKVKLSDQFLQVTRLRSHPLGGIHYIRHTLCRGHIPTRRGTRGYWSSGQPCAAYRN